MVSLMVPSLMIQTFGFLEDNEFTKTFSTKQNIANNSWRRIWQNISVILHFVRIICLKNMFYIVFCPMPLKTDCSVSSSSIFQGLSREKMILLAELTGSDYTDGVESVGPVTALEILAEFNGCGLNPLKEFRSWWEKHQVDLSLPPGSKLKEKLIKLRLPDGMRNSPNFSFKLLTLTVNF